jgi:signal transduction histidine kinase
MFTDELELLERLRQGFVADLIELVIPGAIHNFANPLNGLSGRIKLLEIHLAKFIQTIESIHPGLGSEPSLDKISRDVGILREESAKFLGLFRNFEGKILSLSSSEQQMINMKELLEAEVKFADCYLDFKHDVTKTVQIDDNMPLISGNRTGYSLCLCSLINCSRLRLKGALEKNLSISAGSDDVNIRIVLQDSGEKIPEACKKIASEDGLRYEIKTRTDSSCVLSLLLLKLYGFQINIDDREGWNQISLSKSYKT